MKKDNTASVAVAEANGMKKVRGFIDDEKEETVVYAIARNEWGK